MLAAVCSHYYFSHRIAHILDFSFTLKFTLNLPELAPHCSSILITLILDLAKNLSDLLECSTHHVLYIMPVGPTVNAGIKFLKFMTAVLVFRFKVLAHMLSFIKVSRFFH